jgi:hypothetical protein
MNNDVTTVRAMPDFRLQVELADGRVGVFDMRPHLAHPGLSALQDPRYFERVQVLMGAPTWPDGEDIAPSTIEAALNLVTTA